MNAATLGPTALVALSSDGQAESRKLIAGVKEVYGVTLTLPLLSDPEGRVIGRYGLLNMHTAPGPKGRPYATPGTFIVDPEGVVRWRMVDDNWKLRPTNELVMAALHAAERGEDTSRFTLDSLAVEDPTQAPPPGPAPEWARRAEWCESPLGNS